MSRHRAAMPQLPERYPRPGPLPATAVPEAALAAMRGHTELERLCGWVLAFPRTADRLLTECRVPDPVLRHTLLAETALRQDKAREAVVLAGTAATLAGQETPVAPGRLLPAAVVLADAAVLAGRTDAVTSCTDLVLLARQHGDEQRATIAVGLHAAALLHQHSCRAAAELLGNLRHTCADSTVRTAADLAIGTITSGCARRNQPHWPPATVPLITSGGLVQAALTTLVWADRIARWPGIHNCPPTPGRPA